MTKLVILIILVVSITMLAALLSVVPVSAAAGVCGHNHGAVQPYHCGHAWDDTDTTTPEVPATTTAHTDSGLAGLDYLEYDDSGLIRCPSGYCPLSDYARSVLNN